MGTRQAWVIYVLSDPRTPEDVRYVGVTHGRPESRLSKHINMAKKQAKYHSSRWIRSLLAKGIRPVMLVIDTGSGSSWEAVETFWISWHKERGYSLTNHADGGRGPLGCVRTPETRAKLAAANAGKKQSPELIEKRIAPLRGRSPSPAVLERIKSGMQGRKVSPEGLASIAEARAGSPEWNAKIAQTNRETYARRKTAGLVVDHNTGRKHNEETREKLRVSHLGKKQSEETKAKRRESLRLSWTRRKAVKGASK